MNRDLVQLFIPRLASAIERKHVERRLHKAEQRYELATAAAPVGVWDWRVQDGIFDLDVRLKSFLGYGANELTDGLAEWSECIHPEDRDRVAAEIQAHLRVTVARS